MSPVVVVVSAGAALVLRLVAQAVAVKAVGGRGLRLRWGFPLVVVRAALPPQRELALGVLAAGFMACLGGAGALLSTTKVELQSAGVVFVVVGVGAFLPFGRSDGVAVIELLRGRKDPPI